ncbi:o-succinylbenzoate--CoA ligase [Robertmurraya mangrovi]
MPNFFTKRVHLTPNRPAVKFGQKEWTFKELYDLAYKAAGHLQGANVEKKDYIAVLLKNHIDSVVVLLALQLIGTKAVILNNRLTAEELLYQLNDSQASLLISEDSFQDTLNSVKKGSNINLILKEELDEIPYQIPLIQEEIDLDDICTIMYTSGTSGNPKGVKQSYGNHWWSSIGSALNLGITENDCWLCTVPLFHISGYSILMRSIIYGMKVVLHETFDEKAVIHDIDEERVTIMSVVSIMLSRIIETLGEERLPAYFRCMLLGGGPAPLPLLEKCTSKEIPVYQTYGMTETASQFVTLSPEYSLKKLGSAGKALFPSQLKIVDSLGNELPPNESGEIVVKGPNVTSGYLNKDHQMTEGWFFTGDIGYLDNEGFLFVQDRRSDLIISGGENIYPAEIEGILLSHPNIIDVGVIGKEDEKWGQVPVAFIVTSTGTDLDDNQIMQYCSEKLAKYKVPKQIFYLKGLPRNASKKLLRRKLHEWL